MRKKSKSPNKVYKKSIKSKIQPCNLCKKTFNSTLSISNSLFRKYSASQMNYYYLSIFTKQSKNVSQQFSVNNDQNEQQLEKYYKTMSRKHVFPKIKEVYKLHKQIPKILHPIIKQILQKCYHRKRLLEYFKIAKILGIKVQSVKFSTFLLSVNETKKQQLPYDKLITKISTFDFSQEFQKQLLRELNSGNTQNKENKQANYFEPLNSKFKKN